jgi:hypothetical protein
MEDEDDVESTGVQVSKLHSIPLPVKKRLLDHIVNLLTSHLQECSKAITRPLIKYMERFMCYTKAVESFINSMPINIGCHQHQHPDESSRRYWRHCSSEAQIRYRAQNLKTNLHNAFTREGTTIQLPYRRTIDLTAMIKQQP